MIEAMSLGGSLPVKPSENKTIQQATPAELTETFGQYLQKALDGVNAQEVNVHKMNDLYLTGQVDVTQVMIAAEKAQLSLQLTSQVRNKVVEAYQEMMRMQI
ncbi:flagellar hook-basal body complex protein FliE [Paenibacillus chungangensis]|uniref:Flagellar hook-basal body complex protein FliE n=1 Tax=Paenibacillus chungangensis TaxID=696535 RepID=A0ABW3HPL8_9BACL